MSSFTPNQAFDVATFGPAYEKAIQGDTYAFDSGLYACAATEIMCCFVQNDDTERDMVVWNFITGTNGGDNPAAAGFPIPKTFFGRVGITLPTANATAVTLQPTDGNNTAPAPATAFVTASAAGLDNGALSGFTVISQIVAAAKSPHDVGFLQGVVIPPGGSVGCSCISGTPNGAADLGTCMNQYLCTWVRPGTLAS